MSNWKEIITAKAAFVVDAFERSLKTFVQFFVLQLIMSGWFTVEGFQDSSILAKAAYAGGGAALSVLSSILSKLVNDPDSAALITPPAPA